MEKFIKFALILLASMAIVYGQSNNASSKQPSSSKNAVQPTSTISVTDSITIPNKNPTGNLPSKTITNWSKIKDLFL